MRVYKDILKNSYNSIVKTLNLNCKPVVQAMLLPEFSPLLKFS